MGCSLCSDPRIYFLKPKKLVCEWRTARANPASKRGSFNSHSGPEVIDSETDRGQLEQKIRALTGRADVHIIDVRRKQDDAGKTLRYEVDIR